MILLITIVLSIFTFQNEVLSEPPSHDIFDELLHQYVSEKGSVDYKGLAQDKERLKEYTALLSENPPHEDWSRYESLTYWINAYNAFTLEMIIDHYPVSSITKLHDGKPWDVKWINIGDKQYSLNQIENDIIRPQYKEPRIHFAVNCAASSCPPLLNEAFQPYKLDEQLELQTKKFINNKDYNQISGKNARISKIFEWYGEDFGDLKSYIKKYTGISPRNITYNEYDWSLNSK